MDDESKAVEDQPKALPDALAATLVFGSSGAVLVLEIVAQRLIGPYVGLTLQTTSSVIGMALAAIAYGAWAGGWLADRRDPRTMLAPALILAGIATALTFPLIRYAGEILRGNAAGGVLLLTALAVVVPAGLLSAISPMVVKLQLSDLRRTGQVVGRLSGLGTLGGITATLGTGFVLVAALPSRVIMLSLAVLLGVSGLALGWYLRRLDAAGTPKARVTAAVVGLVAAGLTAIAPTPCDVETEYSCASVVADQNRPGGRTLVLNAGDHSYVDLNDPRHLEFEYVQWIAAVSDVAAPAGAPVTALHVGGGGFTLPQYLAAVRPGSAQTVLELDGELVELDKAELGLETGPDLRVVVGDARVSLAGQPAGAADFVVGDAFGDLVVPWHLSTREMAVQVRGAMKDGAIYAQNVIDYPPLHFIRAQTATVQDVFPHVALIGPPDGLAGKEGANFVIVASAAPLPLDAIRARMAQTVPGPVTMLDGAELAAFVDDARVLTDDYAPVDQLLSR
ncbi:fused MFS/spermidine synthase [Catenuloplanes indicus]|uniref:Spermidine synthase n=1 Tax=Catenuloplanes indicus TaxID=137267 RepID=A0AAE3W0U2_9ACTN|nr:fused MFS/spermidine synthase [Catenuloplanes indicus]MDQ0367250.1 spermidine synthase [Catenuloplanes indicus]